MSIGVEQSADHPLVLRAMLRCFALEEFDAALRKRDRDFYALLAEGERLRGGQKVGNDLQLAQRFIGVSDFLGHRFACPFASNPHQRFEQYPHGK